VLISTWAPRHEDVLGEWRYSSTYSLTYALYTIYIYDFRRNRHSSVPYVSSLTLKFVFFTLINLYLFKWIRCPNLHWIITFDLQIADKREESMKLENRDDGDNDDYIDRIMICVSLIKMAKLLSWFSNIRVTIHFESSWLRLCLATWLRHNSTFLAYFPSLRENNRLIYVRFKFLYQWTDSH